MVVCLDLRRTPPLFTAFGPELEWFLDPRDLGWSSRGGVGRPLSIWSLVVAGELCKRRDEEGARDGRVS